jgi:hydroxyethylthiazole kinase-like uncharacterized protein yjeF
MKIVSAAEMSRIESVAYQSGASELEFMENAGKGIAERAKDYILARGLDKKITLLVGKGNNGGDALAAGKRLIKEGFSVSAWEVFPVQECSPLCQKQHEEFKKAGGSFSKHLAGVLLDGLTGTGFHGKAEGPLLDAIEKANASKLPILAIDIPSGLNGSTGEVGSVAIQATETIYLGLPKVGFFLKDGWNTVGELQPVDFGLGEAFIEQAKASYILLEEASVSAWMPKVRRNRHKYQAGYVVAVAGSRGFSGAAFLSCLAALRAGAGIVRLFHASDMDAEMGGAPYEIVKEEIEGPKRILEEGKRAKAFLIGPGMGRHLDAEKLLHALLKEVKKPLVLDADALFHLAENPRWKIPKDAILTPHRKEAERLLGISEEIDELELHGLCQNYVEKKETTLILKGAPTFIFQSGQLPWISCRGDPGMATAGTGDVLTGILAALLAQGLSCSKAAALGTMLHGISGEIAALHKGSHLIASDLIDTLPDAFLELLAEVRKQP